MAIWDLDAPLDTALANTIHTILQAAKTDIIERARVTNTDAVDEHDFYGATATGAHAISQVGFVSISTTLNALQTFRDTYFPQDGTLHFVDSTDSLYIIHGTEAVPVITTDHGELANLTTLTEHTQYLATDGSRTMSGNLTLASSTTLSVTSLGTNDDSALGSDHVTQHWYAAHGANGIATATYADSSVTSVRCSVASGVSPVIADYSFYPVKSSSDAPIYDHYLIKDSGGNTQYHSLNSVLVLTVVNESVGT